MGRLKIQSKIGEGTRIIKGEILSSWGAMNGEQWL
jgi:hypothetical protein